jgi:hypothetical protein
MSRYSAPWKITSSARMPRYPSSQPTPGSSGEISDLTCKYENIFSFKGLHAVFPFISRYCFVDIESSIWLMAMTDKVLCLSCLFVNVLCHWFTWLYTSSFNFFARWTRPLY